MDMIEKIEASGFKKVSDHNPALYVKIWRQGEWWCGKGLIVWDRGWIFSIGTAVHISEANAEALPLAIAPVLRTMAANVQVSGDENLSKEQVKKLDKPFKRRLNKFAKKMAKMKILQKLRNLYAKALQSPIASAGIQAAASALNAFGVPGPVTKMALNQARFATIDRMKKGGYAGMVARATEAGVKNPLLALGREALQRNVKAAGKGVMAAIPGAGLLSGGGGGGGGLLGKLGGGGGGGGDSPLGGLAGKLAGKLGGEGGGKLLAAVTSGVPVSVDQVSPYDDTYLIGYYL